MPGALAHRRFPIRRDVREPEPGSASLTSCPRRQRQTCSFTDVVLVGTLNAVGFGAGGVVAGSIAAGIQSAFYGGAVASGSLFAIAQSIGAGGAALATVGGASLLSDSSR
ncbi:hypothetical protein C8F04DRAFT_1235467 [Mycena alexandri]|uniref:Uncharacterized protein n=1 Tax=Mycena alexandri TaxID=1745969 RepID=A0AAD6X4Y8_9AGAR|nr:hypothetical protein C8F04DRAFT_1235467 [Mycena alexandri]